MLPALPGLPDGSPFPETRPDVDAALDRFVRAALAGATPDPDPDRQEAQP